MRGSRASIGRPRLADLTVVAEIRLEAVNSGRYQSQGSGNGIICQVQCLIMLARGIGVQVSHQVGRLHRLEEGSGIHSAYGEF